MNHSQLQIKEAFTFSSRLKGLMFKKELRKNEGILIKPCNSIHTCFMRFDIDTVFLSKEMKVLKIQSNVKPWRMIAPVKNAYSVLELQAGMAKELQIKENNILDI